MKNRPGQVSTNVDDVVPTHTATLEYPLVYVRSPVGLSAADALEAPCSKNREQDLSPI